MTALPLPLRAIYGPDPQVFLLGFVRDHHSTLKTILRRVVEFVDDDFVNVNGKVIRIKPQAGDSVGATATQLVVAARLLPDRLVDEANRYFHGLPVGLDATHPVPRFDGRVHANERFGLAVAATVALIVMGIGAVVIIAYIVLPWVLEMFSYQILGPKDYFRAKEAGSKTSGGNPDDLKNVLPGLAGAAVGPGLAGAAVGGGRALVGAQPANVAPTDAGTPPPADDEKKDPPVLLIALAIGAIVVVTS